MNLAPFKDHIWEMDFTLFLSRIIIILILCSNLGITEFYTFNCILDWDNASSLNSKKILLQLRIMIFISILRVILTRSMNECSQENRYPLDYGKKKTFK